MYAFWLHSRCNKTEASESCGILFNLLFFLWLLRSLPIFIMQLAAFLLPVHRLQTRMIFSLQNTGKTIFSGILTQLGSRQWQFGLWLPWKSDTTWPAIPLYLGGGKYQSHLPEINVMEKICKLPHSKAGSYIFLWLLLWLQSHDQLKIMDCYWYWKVKSLCPCWLLLPWLRYLSAASSMKGCRRNWYRFCTDACVATEGMGVRVTENACEAGRAGLHLCWHHWFTCFKFIVKLWYQLVVRAWNPDGVTDPSAWSVVSLPFKLTDQEGG